jgi:hypothetical protein
MAIKLLLAEIRYRLGASALTIVAILVAAGLFVAGPALLKSYANASQQSLAARQDQAEETLRKLDDQTRVIMLRLGFNVRIVHRDTDLSSMLSDYTAVEFPQSYVDKLAQSPKVNKIAHIAGALIHPLTLDSHKRMLIGYAREAEQPHEAQKKPIVLDIAPGTVVLGFEAGRNHNVGDSIDLLGHPAKIARILERRDSHDDLMVAVPLADAQTILGKAGKINAILAISCRCKSNDRISEVSDQITKVLPDVQVTEAGTQAGVRAEQRAATKRVLDGEIAAAKAERGEQQERLADLVGAITPLVVLAAAVWVAALAWTNALQRRGEIGLLRAIGKSTSYIAGMFLGKAVLLGLLGGALGATLGIAAARTWSRLGMGVNMDSFVIPTETIGWAIAGSALIAAIAAYLPTLWVVRQDPAVALRDA